MHVGNVEHSTDHRCSRRRQAQCVVQTPCYTAQLQRTTGPGIAHTFMCGSRRMRSLEGSVSRRLSSCGWGCGGAQSQLPAEGSWAGIAEPAASLLLLFSHPRKCVWKEVWEGRNAGEVSTQDGSMGAVAAGQLCAAAACRPVIALCTSQSAIYSHFHLCAYSLRARNETCDTDPQETAWD